MAGQHEETTSEQFAQRLKVAAEINTKLAALMADGVPPEDERVLNLLTGHHEWVTQYLKRDKSTYIALGKKYISDDRFEGVYKEYGPGLANYMGLGIIAYAEARLTDNLDDDVDPASFHNQ